MNYCRLRQFLPGILIVSSLNAFAETPPPATPFEVINWKATIKQPPTTGLKMGMFPVRFEKTTLDNVRRVASIGAIAHRGDAGESAYWLCYTNVGVTQAERIWLVAHGEMGGHEHYVTSINAKLIPGGSATADCPALPNNLKPLSLDNHLWLGASRRAATTTLGAPSFRKGAWQSYDFQGKVPGDCQGGGFDLIASLLLNFQKGHVISLQAAQVTSC